MTTPKLTKSWILTLIAFACTIIFPIANDALTEIGIIITETEMTYYLSVFLSVAGFGTASSIRKHLQNRKTGFKEIQTEKDVVKIEEIIPVEPMERKAGLIPQVKLTPPQLGPIGSFYQTNLRKDSEKGNVLDFGQSYLWIKMVGVRSYLTVKLKSAEGVPIQIDQSHELDEDNDIETTRLEMFMKTGAPLPKGKYILEVRGDRGTSDSSGIKNDPFEIV